MVHPTERALYWLDINGKKLHKFHPVIGTSKQWDLPEVAGSFAFTSNLDLFVMGFASGLSWFVPSSGEVEKICDYEADLNTRPNDGKCDREGNFVIGGYNNNHRNDGLNITGCWRLTKHLVLEEIMDYRFRCSNTIAFNLAGDVMYFCDTPTREIYKFRYSSSRQLTGKQLFYSMTELDQGGPDGATVDSEGGLWEAQAGNWKVVRHRPPSVAIGDPDNSTLYITTARHRLSDEERLQQPGAGQLWAVKLPRHLKGIPEPLFQGARTAGPKVSGITTGIAGPCGGEGRVGSFLCTHTRADKSTDIPVSTVDSGVTDSEARRVTVVCRGSNPQTLYPQP